MKKQPKISVIIPVYNTEKYLRQCLTSVVNQTLKDIEIICVNDGSTDDSLKILQEYAQKDERIKIINKYNGGLSSARNEGIKLASAKYIGFVDSDDWIDKETYEVAFQVAEKNKDVDLICWGAQVFADELGVNSCSSQNYHKLKFNGKKELTDDTCLNITVTVWNKLYKSEIIKKNNILFEEGLLFEDNPFFWKYVANSRYCYIINKYFYHYLKRKNSIMGISVSKKSLKLYDRLIGFEKTFSYYQRKGLSKVKSKLLNTIFIRAQNDEIKNSAFPNKVKKYAKTIKRKYKLNANNKKMSLFSKYYSKDGKYKVIEILGIKIKIKNKKHKNKSNIDEKIFFDEISNIFTNDNIKNCKQIYRIDVSQYILSLLKNLKHFYFYPNNGNLGDVAIAESEYQLFEKEKLSYKVWDAYSNNLMPTEDFNLVYGGGGLFVKYWNYKKVIELFNNQHLKQVIILPSSFWECDDLIDIFDERFIVFCREKKSYDYCCNRNKRAKFYLDNDMAFSLSLNKDNKFIFNKTSDEIKGIYKGVYQSYTRVMNNLQRSLISNTEIIGDGVRLGYFLRNDAEKVVEHHFENIVDISRFACSPCTDRGVVHLLSSLFYQAINTVDAIITDRLHVGIIASLLGKRVVLLDNSYGKISGVYNHTMNKRPNIKLVDNLQNLDDLYEYLAHAPKTANVDWLEKTMYFKEFLENYSISDKNLIAYKNTIWEPSK